MSGELQALRYLTPDREAFWEWKDDGDVIAYRVGGTLAFREQLLCILKHLGDKPLPSLETILLVLAACRDSWPDDRKQLQSEFFPLAKSARPLLKHWWASVFDALERVHAMPRQMRSDPSAVTTMIDIVFDGRTESLRKMPPELLKILSQPRWGKVWTNPEPLIVPFGERTQGYSQLTQGLLKISVETVLNRKSTGLDQLPEPPQDLKDLLPEELPETRTVQQLIHELRDDNEYRGLMRVVRTLSAVLTLPRELTVPELLPQGGVSDITNRGPLDRLLLSELAHDDMTLMTRIALNEALYIRRETPPAQPSRQRSLLIDGGIRMWGLPRLCATAVGLCLSAQASVDHPASVYRSDQDGLQSVDFTTREGLAAHLAALDCLLHPGAVLPEWLETTAGKDQSSQQLDPLDDLETDRILVVGEDVLADVEFRTDLRKSACAPVFVVTVNREGRTRLIQWTANGEKLLRELWIDIDTLVKADDNPKTSLTDRTADTQLPALFRLKRMPLRMPYPYTRPELLIPYPQVWENNTDLLQITFDRRLLLWDVPGYGGRQITDLFPAGQLRWSGKIYFQSKIVSAFCLVMCLQTGEIKIVRLRPQQDGGIEVEQSELNLQRQIAEFGQIIGIYNSQSALMVVLRRRIIAVSALTGEILADHEIEDGLRYQSGGYFFENQCWGTATFWNGQIRMDPILNVGVFPKDSRVIGFLGEAENRCAIFSAGYLYRIIERKGTQVVSPDAWTNATVRSIAPDQLSCVMSGTKWGAGLLKMDNQSKAQFQKLGTDIHSYWGGKPTQLPTDESLFRNLNWIEYGKHLAIVSKSGNRFVLDSRPERNSPLHLRAPRVQEETLLQKTLPFQEIPGPPGVDYTLRQVTWEDGSRAVLDSRGMLHLQSSDRTIPELTLVLNERNVSGWCSTGEIWGREYFLDERCPGVNKVSPDRIKPILSQFLGRLK